MERTAGGTDRLGGLAGWLVRKMRCAKPERPRLALIDRMALGPRQSLVLVEAEGRRILVATSAEGGPAFYPLDAGTQHIRREAQRTPGHGQARISW